MKQLSSMTAVIASVVALGASALFSMPALSDSKTFRAGTPGDPKKPFRVIEVLAKESDKGMSYEPSKLMVEQGEQVKFVIKNVGELDHEFMLDTIAANQKHAIAMQKNPEMQHEEPNGRRIVTKKQDDIVWKFNKRGTFEYACLIPGHYEAGMKGTVEVVAKGKMSKAAAATK